MAAAMITPADLAAELGTDPKTCRKFLRSITPKDEQPGKGSRWAIKGTKTEIAAMRKKFTAFQAAQEEAKAKREEAKKAKENAAAEVEAQAEIAAAFPKSDDEGPDDAELEQMEIEAADEAADLLEVGIEFD